MKRYAFLALVGAVAALSSCNSDSTTSPNNSDTTRYYYGPSKALGQGTAQAWVKLDSAGNPASLGVTLSDKALVGLPSDSMGAMVYLQLPAQAKTATPFDHVSLDWNPYGHPPPGVYDKPHFDIHFYTVDSASQMAVMPGLDTVKDTALYPMGYVSDYQSVPMMGVHYVPLTDLITQNFNFQHTLIYGFHQNHFYFLEPMITREFILGNNNVTLPIPQPAKYAFPGKYFPTKYTIATNSSSKVYTIALDSLVKR